MENIYAETSEEYLKTHFLEIIEKEQISTVFQPIISLRDGSIYGYEALSRGPQTSILHSPCMLFEMAKNSSACMNLNGSAMSRHWKRYIKISWPEDCS